MYFLHCLELFGHAILINTSVAIAEASYILNGFFSFHSYTNEQHVCGKKQQQQLNCELLHDEDYEKV